MKARRWTRFVFVVAGVSLGACGSRGLAEGPDGGIIFPGGPVDLASTSPEIYNPTVNQVKPPPPITGGTVTVLHDGHTVAVSDPDRDKLYIAETNEPRELRGTIALDDGDLPGQLVQDNAGRVHVLLRGAGEVARWRSSTWRR
jgi:hypothetical protein